MLIPAGVDRISGTRIPSFSIRRHACNQSPSQTPSLHVSNASVLNTLCFQGQLLPSSRSSISSKGVFKCTSHGGNATLVFFAVTARCLSVALASFSIFQPLMSCSSILHQVVHCLLHSMARDMCCLLSTPQVWCFHARCCCTTVANLTKSSKSLAPGCRAPLVAWPEPTL